MKNPRLDEAQAGIKIARRHINNLTFAYDTTLMAESEEEVKCLLMKVKEAAATAREESARACPHSSTLAWKIPWTERLLRAW